MTALSGGGAGEPRADFIVDGLTENSAGIDPKGAGVERDVTTQEIALPPAQSPDNVGAALRNAFQAAVQEDIPQEMLDLLRRLD